MIMSPDVSAYPRCPAGLLYFRAVPHVVPGRGRSVRSLAEASGPPAAPPRQGICGPLLQAHSLFIVADITHSRRRVPPASGCLVGPPQPLVGAAEVNKFEACLAKCRVRVRSACPKSPRQRGQALAPLLARASRGRRHRSRPISNLVFGLLVLVSCQSQSLPSPSLRLRGPGYQSCSRLVTRRSDARHGAVKNGRPRAPNVVASAAPAPGHAPLAHGRILRPPRIPNYCAPAAAGTGAPGRWRPGSWPDRVARASAVMNAGVDATLVNRARWRSAPVPRWSSRCSSRVIVSVSPWSLSAG